MDRNLLTRWGWRTPPIHYSAVRSTESFISQESYEENGEQHFPMTSPKPIGLLATSIEDLDFEAVKVWVEQDRARLSLHRYNDFDDQDESEMSDVSAIHSSGPSVASASRQETPRYTPSSSPRLSLSEAFKPWHSSWTHYLSTVLPCFALAAERDEFEISRTMTRKERTAAEVAMETIDRLLPELLLLTNSPRTSRRTGWRRDLLRSCIQACQRHGLPIETIVEKRIHGMYPAQWAAAHAPTHPEFVDILEMLLELPNVESWDMCEACMITNEDVLFKRLFEHNKPPEFRARSMNMECGIGFVTRLTIPNFMTRYKRYGSVTELWIARNRRWSLTIGKEDYRQEHRCFSLRLLAGRAVSAKAEIRIRQSQSARSSRGQTLDEKETHRGLAAHSQWNSGFLHPREVRPTYFAPERETLFEGVEDEIDVQDDVGDAKVVEGLEPICFSERYLSRELEEGGDLRLNFGHLGPKVRHAFHEGSWVDRKGVLHLEVRMRFY